MLSGADIETAAALEDALRDPAGSAETGRRRAGHGAPSPVGNVNSSRWTRASGSWKRPSRSFAELEGDPSVLGDQVASCRGHTPLGMNERAIAISRPGPRGGGAPDLVPMIAERSSTGPWPSPTSVASSERAH